MSEYGIDINKLEQFVNTPVAEKKGWGSYAHLLSVEAYDLERFEISSGQQCLLKVTADREAMLFIETGTVAVNGILLGTKEAMGLYPADNINIVAKEKSVVYGFSAPAEDGGSYFKKSPTTDVRDKYWG